MLGLCAATLAWACSSEPETPASTPHDAATGGDANHPDQSVDGEPLHDATGDNAYDASTDTDAGSHDAPSDIPSDQTHDADAGPTDAPDEGGDGPAIDAQDESDGASEGASDGGLGTAVPVCYFGDFDLEGSEQIACIGFPELDRDVLASPGLAAGFEVTAAAFSPDGKKLALAGRASPTDAVSLQVYSLANGTVTAIDEAPSTTQTIERIAFSRDGQWLAMIADFVEAGTMSLFAVPAAGGARKRLSPPTQPGLEVTDMAWARGTASPSLVAFVGDVHTDGVRELMTVDAKMSHPTATAVLSASQLGASSDVQDGVQWDDEGRIVFRSNFGSASAWQLYRSGVGGAGVDVIPGTVHHNGAGQSTIASFAVSNDGGRIAWSTNAPSASLFDVYVMSLAPGAPAAERVSLLPIAQPSTGVFGPSLPGSIAWSPMDDSLAVVADWPLGPTDRDDNFSVFVLRPDSPADGLRLLGSPNETDRNVRDVQFLSNGAALAARGDLIVDGAFELFVSTDLITADQNLLTTRVEEVPPQGDVLGIATAP